MTATQIRQFHDLDLFVDMLAAEQARATRRMEVTASSTVALAGVWTFLAAWLA